MESLSLLLKPASGLCNMNCRYCFYHDEMKHREVDSYGMMSEETAETIIRKAMSSATASVSFGFQGGEPTLRGLSFYESFVSMADRYNEKGIAVSYAMQTNGYDLNEEWARFFHEHHFLIGLSLDGIEETHDGNRIDQKGNGTFQKILQTAELFDRFEVEYNILTVVNGETASKADEIYAFYKEHGFRFLQFIPELAPMESHSEQSLTVKQYGAFLCTIFDRFYEDFMKETYVSIRDFENYLLILLGQAPEACGMCGVCQKQYAFEANGDCYPCDFYILDDYRLGNIMTDSYSSFDEKRAEIAFIEQSRQIPDNCKSCTYLKICRNGCRRYRTDQERNVFCESYRVFFEHSLPRLIEIARLYAQS